MPNEVGWAKGRSGGMSVSLAGPDGRVLGGGLAGMLVAASRVQVTCSFRSMKTINQIFLMLICRLYTWKPKMPSKLNKGKPTKIVDQIKFLATFENPFSK